MNREDIIRMAREAGFREPNPHDGCMGVAYDYRSGTDTGASLERFAKLVAAAKDADHKEAMRWDVHTCGPTCKRYACVATREAVAAEREACAKVADEADEYNRIGDAIRARGQQ